MQSNQQVQVGSALHAVSDMQQLVLMQVSHALSVGAGAHGPPPPLPLLALADADAVELDALDDALEVAPEELADVEDDAVVEPPADDVDVEPDDALEPPPVPEPAPVATP
jgi:hypothetical protein